MATTSQSSGGTRDLGITRPARGVSRKLWIALFVALLGVLYVAGWWYLYETDPVRYAMWLNEDGLAEYGTAVSFLIAAAATAWMALRGRGRTLRIVSAVCALGLFGLGMEEVSWGQRLLGLETPEALRQVNLQQEITLHNVLSGGALRWIIIVTVLTWLALSAWVARDPVRHERYQRWGLPLAEASTAGLFIVVVVGLWWYPLVKLTEGYEFLLGLAVMIWAIERSLRHTVREHHRPTLRVAALGAALLLMAGSATVLTIKRPIWYGEVLDIVTTRGYTPQGKHAHALEIYEYIETTPKNMKVNTRLDHAATLAALGRSAEAQDLLRRSLPYYQELAEKDPSPTNLRLLGRCYRQLGMTAEAAAIFERAQAMGDADAAPAIVPLQEDGEE